MELSELTARYSASAAGIKARLKYLELDPGSIDAEGLAKLDALAEHLAAGQSITSFNYAPVANVEVISKPAANSAALALPDPEMPFELNLEDLDRIYTFLQRAADNGWHLPTSVIRSLTGATPRGRYWKRYGFEFTPATKHGSERAWAVAAASWDFPPH